MAIDAVISSIEEREGECILGLSPRIGSDGQASFPGQAELRIQNPTFIPLIGQEVWGGSDTVIIEPGCGEENPHRYLRSGYTKLFED